VGGERPELEALNSWFRRRERDWWRRNWPLRAVSFTLMLVALGCEPIIVIGSPANLPFVTYAVLYLVLLGPMLVLLFFTLQLLHSLPHEDMAFPFSPALVYRTLLRNALRYALVPLAVLWLPPMLLPCVANPWMYVLVLQQGVVLLAILQLQGFVVIYLKAADLRSIYVYTAPLLLVGVNLVSALLGWVAIQNALSVSLLAWWVALSTVALAVMFVALLIRTASMPPGFKGYWEVR
jgi:hypothetical protein